MAEQNSIAELVEKSSSTDVRILLQAKEDAKRALLEDPTNPALITAFEKSSKLLGAAMQEQQKLKSVPEVLAYVGECGRKLGRAKLYKDIQEARLKRQPDGSFRQKDVDRYMLSLATLGTPDGLTEKVADRQRRKEEADIRRAEAAAAKEEFDLAVKQGKFIPRASVELEMAVRAIALRDGLKNALETYVLDIIEAVRGDAKCSTAFLERMSRIIDESLGEYARPMIIDVEFSDMEEES